MFKTMDTTTTFPHAVESQAQGGVDTLCNTPSAGEFSWYAIRVQSKFESLVSAALRAKGYEEFLPLYTCTRKWSDRMKKVDLPLFAGYLFCRFDAQERLLPILTTPGVFRIVSAGRTPVAVADDEIASLQAICRSGLQALPSPFLSVGSRVYVEDGPLAGVEGIVTESRDKKYRLVVSVQLLQRSVAVEIDSNWARPISRETRAATAECPRTSKAIA
jgi:transcription antitermination factor NusG